MANEPIDKDYWDAGSTTEETVQSVSEQTKAEEEPNLKGTLAAVMSLGVFLILTWVVVFYIFIDRF